MLSEELEAAQKHSHSLHARVLTLEQTKLSLEEAIAFKDKEIKSAAAPFCSSLPVPLLCAEELCVVLWCVVLCCVGLL